MNFVDFYGKCTGKYLIAMDDMGRMKQKQQFWPFFLWFLLKHIPHQIRDSQKPMSKVSTNIHQTNVWINFKISLELQTFQFVFNLYPLQSCNKCPHCPQEFAARFRAAISSRSSRGRDRRQRPNQSWWNLSSFHALLGCPRKLGSTVRISGL